MKDNIKTFATMEKDLEKKYPNKIIAIEMLFQPY